MEYIPQFSTLSSDYLLEEEIGQGSFAIVYKAIQLMSGSKVAIKVVNKNKLNNKLYENLMLEVAILKRINHPNVVKFIEMKSDEKWVFLVLEYCQGGDLSKRLKALNKSSKGKGEGEGGEGRVRVSEAIVKRLTYQIASALECLRSFNCIHRDLKPQNLLLTEPNLETTFIKLGDFGFARYIGSEAQLAETLCGSPLYMAPEILRYEKYNAKADLWSLGTIMYELLIGKPPFRASNHIQLLKKIEKSDIDDLLPLDSTILGLSSDCVSLLRGLLRKNPMERMNFEELFLHPFLKLIDLSRPAATALSKFSPNDKNEIPTTAHSSHLSTSKSGIPIPMLHHNKKASLVFEEPPFSASSSPSSSGPPSWIKTGTTASSTFIEPGSLRRKETEPYSSSTPSYWDLRKRISFGSLWRPSSSQTKKQNNKEDEANANSLNEFMDKDYVVVESKAKVPFEHLIKRISISVSSANDEPNYKSKNMSNSDKIT